MIKPPPLLLSGGLHACAARWPAKQALRCGEEVLTYGQLSDRVARVAGALRQAGIRRGDRVAILAPNCTEYAEIVVGAADAGAVIATLSARATAPEVQSACDDCGARLLIVHRSLRDVAQRIAGPVERIVEIGPEYERWLRSATPLGPDPEVQEHDPFTLVYSSGTTGRPKGILISHRSRALTFHGMAMEYGCYGPDDRQLGIAPMAHGAGFAFIMATLYTGGFVEILPKFDPELIARKLAQETFTGVFMVPAHFHAIFGLERATLDQYRGGSDALRTIMSNAAALPPPVKTQIIDYWGNGKLHETYGSTEAGIVTNLRPQYQQLKPRSVGPAFALNTIRLLGEQGEEVGAGEVGELFSRSPYLFSGYWNQPAETRAVIRDGWVSAGDLARRDDDGFIYIVDRKKDMVVTGGFNVYPKEVEDVLMRHPAISEAAVVGVPDARWGEALLAFIVVRRGASAPTPELDRICRSNLSDYKVPKQFRIVESLPRNAGGKIMKNELRSRQ